MYLVGKRFLKRCDHPVRRASARPSGGLANIFNRTVSEDREGEPHQPPRVTVKNLGIFKQQSLF